MNKPAVLVILSPDAFGVAQKIAARTGAEIHGAQRRCADLDVTQFENVGDHLTALFEAGRCIIAIMASGAVVRLLAPVLSDKHSEPPVISVSEDGASIVPLLGGHHGANQIARVIAEATGGYAAITTAGDLRFGVALDEPPEGFALANPENAKAVMAALLSGARASVTGDAVHLAQWLRDSGLSIAGDGEPAEVTLTVSTSSKACHALELLYYPKINMLGMGCERGCDADHLVDLMERACVEAGIAKQCVCGVYSIDVKADETGLHDAAQHVFGLDVGFYSAERLEQEAPRLKNPSDVVFAEVGCHGVAEGAALAASGTMGELILPKIKTKRATAAIARAKEPLMAEQISNDARARGHLSVVGIGPGGEGWRSPEVTRLVGEASDLVAYGLYLDLLGPLCDGKTRHDFDLGKEEDRVRHAMELAGEGKNVALVCSGDAGIYAMATLVFELLENGRLSEAAKRIAIQVSPGISALQGAAARAGAPLGHDFCTISLSDLLTPWEAIKMRVKAAAEGDFVIAFYNPVSKRRRTQLAYAKDVLLQHRPNDTPVILATNLGREGEAIRVVPLVELKIDDVDMLTVVVVGSSETRTVSTGDGKTWVYTPRGYSAKEGTQINQEENA